MAKGFLSGVIMGGVVSVLGLAVVSPMLPPIKSAPMNEAVVETLSDTTEPAVDTPLVEESSEMTDAAPATEAVDEAPAIDPDDAASETEAAPVDEPSSAEPSAPMTADDSGSVQDPATTPTPETPEADTPPDATPDADAPEVSQSEQGGFGTAVTPIDDRATGVTTNRLPSIDGDAEDPEAVTQVEPEDGTIPEAAPEVSQSDFSNSPLAIERNSVPHPATDGRPLMAIVLKDMGEARNELQGVDNLPFTISVIVDVNAPDLDDAIAFYREAGAEILIQADLPAGSTPTDAEVNFQVQQPNLNKGAAVFMKPESGFQTNAPLSRQIAEILVTSGHGLVTRPEGLNTGHKNALKIGVPSGLVFRDLDGNGQDSKMIRRFMDNAAFKASLENGVILMGRAVPETMAALIEWNLGNRANSVALVPVSTVLLGGT
ncbi:divergent polysaccharide deacetylase family protein [Aliiroseovarius sp. F20344]|uniref:divergent polysaccharide deacetylase family protein n=1 Tax=Aliiroseovarius sp. F20344 TaxID=2926414 RepID=UPI001FF22BC5|nr:divergent polysaccharide deacetylase family protein [Aliiroseovarius sp. F20344]MCK0143284.1 divergent polysaccharide deacetylase family protein [Aliiroseovarius sp. F20344]